MDATAGSRGIVAEKPAQQLRFEGIVRAFASGYHAALTAPSPAELGASLDSTVRPLRGFAYEGAGMALAVREALNPWSPPILADFIAEQGMAFTYLLHVGAGWAFGWVPRAKGTFHRLDPVLRWLAFDGMGFRDCFFGGLSRPMPLVPLASPRLPYAARAYDQGVGRCLWFTAAGNVTGVCRHVAAYAPERQPDLWAGAGLAVVYAGAPTELELEQLLSAAGDHGPALAQGAAFAAKALQRGGQLAAWHDHACRIICGMPADSAARITDTALANLPEDAAEPAYEIWRRRIQRHLTPASNRIPSL
jgi:enediyne biosynthesis protein E3